MRKYKPKKWFIYTRLIITFLIVFVFGKTTNIVYNTLTSDNTNENKKLSQAIIIDNKEEIYVEENPVLTKYISDPEKGFVVTIDNQTYSLSEEEYNFFVAVVSSESHSNRDDILAVMSVILNRADASGISPVEVVTKPGQFSGYLGGYYLRYLNEDGSLKDNTNLVQEVVADALNGVRNCYYYSFRSWSMSSYSDNYIAYGGNRFN